MGWAGTLYLLACSMPAGALIPVLDMLMERLFHKAFLATHYASRVTDYLPFSFWVRPFLMEPVYLAAQKLGAKETASASSAAVLAGHLMMWAGTPATMHQRNFVPDWHTCVLM